MVEDPGGRAGHRLPQKGRPKRRLDERGVGGPHFFSPLFLRLFLFQSPLPALGRRASGPRAKGRHTILTIHHLRISQSERIVWLCEELGLDYELKLYDRDPETRLAPPELKAIHPMQIAPVIEDGDVKLGESGAIVEYIVGRYAPDSDLVPGPDDPDFADHLYWFHFANATFMTNGMMQIAVGFVGAEMPAPLMKRVTNAWDQIERRLGEADYFGGRRLTTADIMMVFQLTTSRAFREQPIGDRPNLKAYLKRIGARDAYQQAMAKAEPGFPPKLD